MIDFQPAIAVLEESQIPWPCTKLKRDLELALDKNLNGNLERWFEALANLPQVKSEQVALNQDCIQVGLATNLNSAQHGDLKHHLKALHPWRKGPFELFGLKVDSEWRSDWKWQRISPHLSPLKDRLVLDVGCGNGYYALRMAAEGATVFGIDPSMLFVSQFAAITGFMKMRPSAHCLPFGIEQVPANLHAFDTVFSMGVLYHRRNPAEHINALVNSLRPGGELVLETLVIDGGKNDVLIPEGRYAKMRNVWYIPSIEHLFCLLKQAGLKEIRLIDDSITTTEEQRSTEWMTWESLANFLDPTDKSKTIEGHPAPRRASIIAS